jgi:hypothetical protein
MKCKQKLRSGHRQNPSKVMDLKAGRGKTKPATEDTEEKQMYTLAEATMRLVPRTRSTMGFLCELCGKNF